MNHRESWAEERHAPSREDWEKELRGESEPKTRKPRAPAPAAEPAPAAPAPARVILRRKSGE